MLLKLVCWSESLSLETWSANSSVLCWYLTSTLAKTRYNTAHHLLRIGIVACRCKQSFPSWTLTLRSWPKACAPGLQHGMRSIQRRQTARSRLELYISIFQGTSLQFKAHQCTEQVVMLPQTQNNQRQLGAILDAKNEGGESKQRRNRFEMVYAAHFLWTAEQTESV